MRHPMLPESRSYCWCLLESALRRPTDTHASRVVRRATQNQPSDPNDLLRLKKDAW